MWEFTEAMTTNSPSVSMDHSPSPPVRVSLEQLPDVALGKIISYLHWREKEWFAEAFSRADQLMSSPLAWENFENDRSYATEMLNMSRYLPILLDQELFIITKYGRFFQSCTLWIHKVNTVGEGRDNDFRLLEAVNQHCTQLKLLRIFHPEDVSITKLKASIQNYLKPLQEAATARGTSLKLSLNRLFYSSTESMEAGTCMYMKCLAENELLKRLVCLDFSHGLLCDSKCNHSLSQLLSCVNLQTLKCPIHTLNTVIVTYLGSRMLKDLYVVNDDHTQQLLPFLEKMYLDWSKIHSELSAEKREKFSVHYIFRNRALCNEDIIPNPFLKSLIFDNLSSNISSALLHHIADTYGQTLVNLAFCSHYWEFLMHFTDLGKINESFKYLGRKCVKLKSFVSCLSLPSSALMCLARTSEHMSTVKVYKENIRLSMADQPEGLFVYKMAKAMGISHWELIKKGENIFNIPNANCSLLFTKCFREL